MPVYSRLSAPPSLPFLLSLDLDQTLGRDRSSGSLWSFFAPSPWKGGG